MAAPIAYRPPIIDEFSRKNLRGVWEHLWSSNGFIEPDGTFTEKDYQAEKHADPTLRARILACEEPFGENGAKKLGKSAPARSDWSLVKYQVMMRVVLEKFRDHPELAEKLLETGDALLIEGNTWHDNTWGDCRCNNPDHPECAQPGLNWLGHVLMSVRESLRQFQPHSL